MTTYRRRRVTDCLTDLRFAFLVCFRTFWFVKMFLLYFVLFLVHQTVGQTMHDSSSFSSETVTPPDPDADRTIEELVASRGFSLETHSVVTEDGYLLSVHRLLPLHYSSTTHTLTHKPVIVQHGLFGASTDFLINSAHLHSANSTYGDTFGFALLLTQRYDVWLPNTRGNDYSQMHLHYRRNPQTRHMDSEQYWNFSFDQIAKYDLPSIVEKVRTVTGSDTVGFVGYSQGATSMFALLSERPEFASQIRPFISWAPVVYMSGIESPLQYLAPWSRLLHSLGHRFAPSSSMLSSLSQPLCKLSQLATLCTNAMFLFGGYDTQHLNRSRLPVYFHFTPATSSTWQVVHFLQLISSGTFQRFDFASAEANTRVYQQSTPPLYNLANIPSNLTIVIVRSENDYLSSIPDTDRLIQELRARPFTTPDSVIDHRIRDPIWTHLDFTLGIDAGRLVYDRTIEYLDRFT